jgi:hypothetical protein
LCITAPSRPDPPAREGAERTLLRWNVLLQYEGGNRRRHDLARSIAALLQFGKLLAIEIEHEETNG